MALRKNNSTAYALIQITEQIIESVDKGNYGCGIFIDLRKAFDTVNHEILCYSNWNIMVYEGQYHNGLILIYTIENNMFFI